MGRSPQPIERATVVRTREPEHDATLAGLPEPIAEEVRRRPVVFIAELSLKLETSVRTIRRQLRANTFFIPLLPKIDSRYRWSRAAMYRAIAEMTRESHAQSLLGPRAVRKPGSAAK